MQYLSDEWMAAAGQALAGSEPLAGLAAPRIALQYEVTGAPDGKRSYTVLLGDGPAALEPGVHAEPDASFTIDYPTAAEIARGEVARRRAGRGAGRHRVLRPCPSCPRSRPTPSA